MKSDRGRGPTPLVRAAQAAGLAVVVACATGCATYTDRVARASLAAYDGNWDAALADYDALLGVESAVELPARLGGERPLLALDRAVVQQAAERFADSARDLSAAEQRLELLDLGSNAIRELGSYLYSDSSRDYKVPPTERLAINAVNLLNYLAVGDLSGAAVEARRFQVMREFLDSRGIRTGAPDRLGAYLAGFVFEKNGEGDRALRYYDEALAGGELPSIDPAVARLARRHPYRGERLEDVISRLSESGAGKAPAGANAPAEELLVVIAKGRVPHKVPERMPVGAAVGIAGAYLGDRDLSILKYSATKVLVYPELAETPTKLGVPELRVGDRTVALDLVADLGGSIRSEYEQAKPKLLAAALTRMATRAAVSEGARAAGRDESDALGDVLAVLIESALVALDRPDTRSWTMLPDRVAVARASVGAGRHTVEVRFGGPNGISRTRTVDVPAGGFAAVVITEPR